MSARNPYLISKALKTFLSGSVLAAVSSQIATTIDAVVVSNLIGPGAISAINVTMPVLTLFTCMMILFGIGASIIAAKAIGRRDERAANGIFTTSIISSALAGTFLAVVIYLFSPEIVGYLTGGDTAIYGYALSYLRVMCVSVPLLMMSGVIDNFVKIDGNPRLVMYAVMAGAILNLVLDIVFVKYLEMGIAGSAWATGLNYLLIIAVCLTHFRKPHCSLKWRPDRKRMAEYTRQSVIQGLPMSINTLLLAASIFLINNIVLASQGADGIYCWSVCLQIFLIMQMVLTGIGSSIYAMGGILAGERDMHGLAILNRKCTTYTVIALGIIAAFIITFPDAFGQLFGSRPDHLIPMLPVALRAFSLMLIPYSIVALSRSTYQILGRTGLSLILSLSQLILMVGFVWSFSFISETALWWGFPASSAILILLLLGYTLSVRTKNPELAFFTLIPKGSDSSELNISVKMNAGSVAGALRDVADFLKGQEIDDMTVYQIRLSCEELMNNLVEHAVKKHPEKHYFDLHIRVDKKGVSVLLKDDGKPFNPILQDGVTLSDADSDEKLGLRLVNVAAGTINYKYMFDQNMVMLTYPF